MPCEKEKEKAKESERNSHIPSSVRHMNECVSVLVMISLQFLYVAPLFFFV